jgi:hypothetical protein
MSFGGIFYIQTTIPSMGETLDLIPVVEKKFF